MREKVYLVHVLSVVEKERLGYGEDWDEDGKSSNRTWVLRFRVDTAAVIISRLSYVPTRTHPLS